MRRRSTLVGALVLLAFIASSAGATLVNYSQDFELLDQTDPFALSADGWLVYGNCYELDGVTYLYGYGPFPAPNDGFAFCQIDLLQGGPEQGLQQLVVFSDYNNGDHGTLKLVESNTYREQTITAENVGETWRFSFNAKMGNLTGISTARAFIKTLNPAAGWALTNFISEDMTSIPVEWSGYALTITIDAGLVGQVLQFGFLNRATNYEGAGIFYDNLSFAKVPVATPPAVIADGIALGQNYPNPFNPTTRIDFTLQTAQNVRLQVFDVAGRRVVTLLQGPLPAGEHFVIWDGRSESGGRVASGSYRYVLEGPDGRLIRSMTLLK